MSDAPKRRGGFNSMTPEKLREIAAKGGGAPRKTPRAFAANPELASKAGEVGGRNGKPYTKTKRPQTTKEFEQDYIEKNSLDDFKDGFEEMKPPKLRIKKGK